MQQFATFCHDDPAIVRFIENKPAMRYNNHACFIINMIVFPYVLSEVAQIEGQG